MKPMSSNRDPLMPRPPGGMRRGLAMALLVHALLVAGLAVGVNWSSSNPQGMQAELWAAVPQVAAPRAAAPEPPPTPSKTRPAPPPEPVKPPPPPPPPPKPEPAPPPKEVLPDPQIAIEQAKKEERERRLEEQREQEREKKEAAKKLAEKKLAEKKLELAKAKAKAEATAKALEAEKLAQQKAEKLSQEKAEKAKETAKLAAAAKAEAAEKEKKRKEEELRQAKLQEAKEKADAKRIADTREAALKRMLSQAGGSTGEVGSKGTADQNAAPSDGYAGRIKARIKPNIVFVDQLTSNPKAEVLVQLAPDGRIISQKLVKSSGSPEWDQAVQRAIDRTEILPRDLDGRVPSSMAIEFRPRE